MEKTEATNERKGAITLRIAARCPVLTYIVCSYQPTDCYAMSGTDIAITLRSATPCPVLTCSVWCYQPTDCYAMSGTDIAYGACYRPLAQRHQDAR
eukprot:2320979-Rhodomonas_salina.1